MRASAGRAGLYVVFEDISRPRHDGKTIYLPQIIAFTTDDDLKNLMASTDHEVAHDRFSCFDVLKDKKIDPKGILMFTWNFLEDSRVNAIEAREYRGFRDNWDECAEVLVNNILTKSVKSTEPTAVLITALICWDSKLCASYFPLCEMVASKFSPVETVLDVLSNFDDRLLECHHITDKREGTLATYQLAVDILTMMGKDCSEEFKPKSGGKGGSCETDEDSEEKTKGEGSSSEFDVIKVVLTEDDLKRFSLTTPEDGKAMGNTGINFDPVALGRGSWDMTDYSKFIVVDYPRKLGNKDFYSPAPTFLRNYNLCVGATLVTQENFAQQVRRLLQIRAKVQVEYGMKKGKLDSSRLARVCFDAPGYNERVFKHKVRNTTLDAALTVLVDMSGSMGGDKALYALASSLLLNEVCSTLGIPLEIIGFSDAHSSETWGSVPSMFIYKSFFDLKVSERDLIDWFAMSSNHMNGNPDGENILWAHDRLVKRKELRKLLIVMSDGSPAASRGSLGLKTFTRDVIQEIEKSKHVEIYGLGLLSSSVTEYYKENSVVNSPQEIPSKLLTLIERKLLT